MLDFLCMKKEKIKMIIGIIGSLCCDGLCCKCIVKGCVKNKLISFIVKINENYFIRFVLKN